MQIKTIGHVGVFSNVLLKSRRARIRRNAQIVLVLFTILLGVTVAMIYRLVFM